MKKLEIRSTNFKYLQRSFRQWLQIRGYVPRTVKSFPILLQEFFHFLEQQGIENIAKVGQSQALKFKLHLQYRTNQNYQSGGIENQTINGILQAMNCFEKFFNESKEQFKLDIYQVYLPIDKTTPTILTQQEIKEIYNATFEQYPEIHGSEAMGQRDRVIIAIFYGCGLRLNEGRNLNIDDIDFFNRRLLVRKGKGKKQRYVPIANKHLEDLKNYIHQGRYWFLEHHHQVNICYKKSIKKQVSKDDRQALILSQTGARMKTMDSRWRYLTQKAGIEKRISTHTFRHSLGAHLLQNGMEIEQIAKILGHSNIDTTQIYTQILETLPNEF